MPPTIRFNFHNIASVEVQSSSRYVRSFFLAEYGYHLTEQLAADLPSVRLNYSLGWKGARGYTHHTHKLLAAWAYQITLDRDHIHHSVIGNRIAIPMVHHMAIHPSLRFLASQRGTLLLHAGAVVKNGKSLIFTGQGGAGKTTTTSLILASDHEWKFHADDYVFLKPGRQSLAYVTRSHLYRPLLNWVPDISSHLTNWEKVKLEFFGFLRARSDEKIKWPVRLSQKRLWPEKPVEDQATPAAILLLERSSTGKPALEQVDDLQTVADDLLEMNFGEAQYFIRLMKKSGIFQDSWLDHWKETEKGLIDSVLRDIPVYRVHLPQSDQSEVVRETLLLLIEDLIH